ncbi:TRAP transporter small permease subunit [Alteromonadaceae bacterium M269]|nr:TRAP transporter small permease subunit [Alteromonadaceae bacterium M269]
MSSSSFSLQLFLDAINRKLCHVISWFTLIMAVLTLLIVVLRYGFGTGWIAMQESVLYLHAAVFLLGSAHTLKADEHVRVDIYYRKFSESRKALVNLGGTLLLALPVNCFIFIMSWSYVTDSWRLLEASQQSGGLPLVFVLKTFILIFAATMTLQNIAEALTSIKKIKSERVD